MATENFTTWTEVEYDNVMSQTAARSTFAGGDSNHDWYLYKDYGAGHFDGDFEHLFEIYTGPTFDGYFAVSLYCIAVQLGDIYDITDGISVYVYRPTVGIFLDDIGGTKDEGVISKDTQYWLTLKKTASGPTSELKIYSDASRTVLVDTLNNSLSADDDFRYIHAPGSINWGGGDDGDGWIQDLDLQEAGGETYELSCTDGIKFGDSNKGSLVLDLALTDGLKGGDTPTKLFETNPIISDGLKVGDTAVAQAILNVLASDGLKLGDSPSYGAIYDLLVSDGIKLGDVPSTIAVLNVLASDGIKLGDIAAHIELWLSIMISDVERYTSVRLPTLRIESVLTQQIDQCEFDLEDTTGDITVTELAELIVKLNDIRRFAGFIRSTEVRRTGRTKVFRATADDYTMLPEFVIVNELYEDMTDKAIIQDIFTNYLSEITTTDYVKEGKTIDRIIFNRRSIRECLNELADISGFDWYIDPDKKLHYFSKEENPAPFGLSDEPNYSTTYPFQMLSYEKDASKLINVQTVRGGTWLTEDLTFYYPGDGVNKNLLINYPLQPEDGQNQIRVWRNNGTQETPSWTALTVGVDGVDAASSKDVLYNQEEKLLKFWAATPNFETSIKIMGRAELPILVRVRSQASKDTYGRWFEGRSIVDKDISSKKIARERGKAVLAEHAFVKERGTLLCHQEGLVVGQLLPIKDSIRGLDDSYLIRRLTTKFLGGEVPEYQVEFGEYNPDLIDLLVGLKRASGQYQGVFDERLEELLDHHEELALSGVGSKVTHATQDYYWDGDGYEGDDYWDFGTWAD